MRTPPVEKPAAIVRFSNSFSVPSAIVARAAPLSISATQAGDGAWNHDGRRMGAGNDCQKGEQHQTRENRRVMVTADFFEIPQMFVKRTRHHVPAGGRIHVVAELRPLTL
jgi:hypothetical protein